MIYIAHTNLIMTFMSMYFLTISSNLSLLLSFVLTLYLLLIFSVLDHLVILFTDKPLGHFQFTHISAFVTSWSFSFHTHFQCSRPLGQLIYLHISARVHLINLFTYHFSVRDHLVIYPRPLGQFIYMHFQYS